MDDFGIVGKRFEIVGKYHSKLFKTGLRSISIIAHTQLNFEAEVFVCWVGGHILGECGEGSCPFWLVKMGGVRGRFL